MMDQLVDMGFPQDLAAKALAATGGKSTLTATEWILGQMESRNSSMPKHQQHPQMQGRVDQFFASSSGRRVVHQQQQQQQQQPGTGSSNFGHQAGEEESNVHWRTRPSSSMSPSPGVDGASEFERKRFLGSASAGKAHDEDLSLSMFRKGNQGPGNQVTREFSGFTPPPTTATKPKNPNLEPLPNTSTNPSKTPLHPRPPLLLEPQNKKRPKPNNHHIPTTEESSPPPTTATTAIIPPVFLNPKPRGPNKKTPPPLAERMRPPSVDLVVGQDHLLGPRCILRSLIDNNSLSSIIFWGPPGTGKTSLVRAIAKAVSYRFIALSAVSSGLKEVREILDEAKRVRKFGERTLLFLDEIHRFNKAQQDAFLPYVEAGHIVFIGATTENPSFEINAALLSRCRVLTLNKLQPDHILTLLSRAIHDKEKGLLLSFTPTTTATDLFIKVEEQALQFLASAADGDARAALNSLEIAGLAAFAALESKVDDKPALKPSDIENHSHHATESVKQEMAPSSLITLPPQNVKLDISGNGFGIKRLEVLKENLKKENASNSADDYTKPFKRFVGGKEVVKGVMAAVTSVAMTVTKEMMNKEQSSPSGETQGDSGAGGYTGLHDVVSKDMWERDGSSERVEKMNGNGLDGGEGGSGSGGGDKKERRIVVTLQQVQEAIQRSHVLYDKTGEEHYNIISALHKSMRGSDPDAAIYWLARMLEGGEGPLYVARRLIRFASEDVGLADPQALVLAVACYQACHFIGMPECNVNLAQCVTYLALAPKSVMVYHAIEAAQRLVKGSKQNEPVPLHLRNAPTPLMKDLGYGRPQQQQQLEQLQAPVEFMPPSLRGQKFLNLL